MIAWTDIESTDLDERAGHLLEVALAITDDDLNELASLSLVTRPVGADIDQVFMPDVVREMHTKSGLLDEVRRNGLRRHEAEELLIKFTKDFFSTVPDVSLKTCASCGKVEKDHVNVTPGVLGATVCPDAEKGEPRFFAPKMVTALSQTPLAGSTVAFDRRWLREHMPALEKLFHYRSIDVSALVELARRWAPEVDKARPKGEGGAKHRALADVRESISYLRYYRKTGFVGAQVTACEGQCGGVAIKAAGSSYCKDCAVGAYILSENAQRLKEHV